MSDVMISEPITDYVDVLEKVFAPDRSKKFIFLYSKFDDKGVEIVETGPEWLLTELPQGSDISEEDKVLIEKCVTYWAAVGGFIKVKVDGRNAVIVRIK